MARQRGSGQREWLLAALVALSTALVAAPSGAEKAHHGADAKDAAQHASGEHKRLAGGHAQGGRPSAASPYAGQQDRPIASLSSDDVEALEDGRGWGFAKPAELNGYPGPLHVLELADKIGLTPEQSQQVTAVRKIMQTQARALGAKFVASERALSQLFADKAATPESISRQIGVSADLRGQLRATHLAAHIAIYPVLTAKQRAQYDRLRGYTGARAEHGGDNSHGHKH
ncbi:MAG: Spy/CpxP family protein refolding chaperone [Pseudomonadota bacterium]